MLVIQNMIINITMSKHLTITVNKLQSINNRTLDILVHTKRPDLEVGVTRSWQAAEALLTDQDK